MKTTSYLVLPLAAALAMAGPWAFLTYPPPFPPADRIREVGQSAVEDSLALALGLRRLAADLWYIRLLQYYGTPEVERPPDETGRHELEAGFGGGRYREFLPMARHLLALDPYFTSAGLYAAGSLAFNMSRPDEALSLLNEALIYRPKEWKYVKLLAAIGYSKAHDPSKVSELLMSLIMEPDCPVMIRQQAAFLNKKAGNYRVAYRIYKTILKTTKDPFYIDNARKEMAKLEKLNADLN
ncbi:MAG: hypothetical protein WCW52_10790 [Elusimicrobiales bacterium]|jgi:tetratricopeptide (TPR) repeat protein